MSCPGVAVTHDAIYDYASECRLRDVPPSLVAVIGKDPPPGGMSWSPSNLRRQCRNAAIPPGVACASMPASDHHGVSDWRAIVSLVARVQEACRCSRPSSQDPQVRRTPPCDLPLPPCPRRHPQSLYGGPNRQSSRRAGLSPDGESGGNRSPITSPVPQTPQHQCRHG